MQGTRGAQLAVAELAGPMAHADQSSPIRAAPPRRSWAGSQLTRGEMEQPRLQPVGPLGRLMDVLACELSPPRPVQPIHNELQFPGLPPGTSSPFSSPLLGARKVLSSHCGACWGRLTSHRCRALGERTARGHLAFHPGDIFLPGWKELRLNCRRDTPLMTRRSCRQEPGC